MRISIPSDKLAEINSWRRITEIHSKGNEDMVLDWECGQGAVATRVRSAAGRHGSLISGFRVAAILAGWVATAGVAGVAMAQEPVAADAPPPSDVLDRFEPLSVTEALDAFDVAPGFRIELVAAEPLVVDPIAFCFDPAGRMIVVEMIDYSEREQDSVGRIRRLTDRNGDGQMDHAETLAEGLSWPTAVEAFPGGVLVGAPPHLYFVPVEDDASGNAVAGKPEIWFTGFSRANVQGMMNSFRWGPDLRLHGASSSNAGDITGITLDEPLRLGRQDFSIDARDRAFRTVPGGAQHGMDFDAWGRKFLTSNSDHLQQALMIGNVPGRSSRYSAVPALRRSIAADGPAADVYRSSPPEPWRILRTHMRMTGAAVGVVEGGGRAAGYFTGATGVHLFEGDQWAPSEFPIAVVCDVGGNLVHRKRLVDQGLWKLGERIDDQSEFVRSSDTWFRPVQLGGGPDGALYIADMYREVIEHPKSLPPLIKDQVDLNSGNDRGRIWRVVAEDRPIRRQTESLDQLDSGVLVAALEHSNHWQRRTAARLLVERNAIEQVPTLRRTVLSAQLPQARLEALAVLEHLDGGIDADLLAAPLIDPHPELRKRALEIAARTGIALSEVQVNRLADDESIETRFTLAYAAPVLIPDTAARNLALLQIAARDPADPWILWAVEGSLGDGAIDFLRTGESVLADWPASARSVWLRAISCQVLTGGDKAAVEQLVSYLRGADSSTSLGNALLPTIIAELGGVRPDGAGLPLAQWVKEQIAPGLMKQAEDRDPALAKAVDRMRLVGWASPQQARELLGMLFTPFHSSPVQQAALVALVSNDPAAAAEILEGLSAVTPSTAELALTTLAARVEGQAAIARAIDSGKLSAESLPVDVKRMLSESRDAAVKKTIEKHLASVQSPPPGELYQTYAKSLHQDADLVQGEAVFRRVCSACHDPQPGFHRVGPDLVTVTDQPKEQILLSVLDPNREVNPKYARVQIVTIDGQVLSGIITDESDSTITLVDSQGKAFPIARGDIDELQTSPNSVMPEELNKEITPVQMRDLIAYLVTRRAEGSTSTGTAP